jgi:hypothetical protein
LATPHQRAGCDGSPFAIAPLSRIHGDVWRPLAAHALRMLLGTLWDSLRAAVRMFACDRLGAGTPFQGALPPQLRHLLTCRRLCSSIALKRTSLWTMPPRFGRCGARLLAGWGNMVPAACRDFADEAPARPAAHAPQGRGVMQPALALASRNAQIRRVARR